MTQLSISGVAVEFGDTALLSDVTFTVAARDRWGIVGRNGSGKTTLFRLITRELEPTRGVVSRSPGLRVSVMEQHRDFGSAATVWEAAAGPFAELFALERSLAEQADALGHAGDATTEAMLERYARDLERFEREGGYTLAPRIDAVLHGLGFDPDRARGQPLESLSGGERGRVGLVRQLIAPADILLLDEPTNHLDLETTEWLEGYLAAVDSTVLVISHDRDFLERVADHILHVEAGTAIPYGGSYSAFVAQRAERRLTQQRAFDRQRKAIESEEDFIRRNIAGGNSAQAKGRRRRLSRVARLSPPPGDAGAMAVRFEPAGRGGDQVIVAEDVRVEIGGRVLLDRFSARVQRGEVVGLVGPNGAGKSTLLRTLVGEREPARGSIRIPDSVRTSHYRQDLSQVPTGDSLYDIIADRRPAWGRGPVQGHLGRFGFSGDSVLRSAGSLSGGERARMALALMMLEGANLLVFDEPTNHLDVESIEALEDALEEFEGTVLLVSHDRALLRALVTRLWVLHDGRVTDYPGTFGEWEAASVERQHAARVAAEEEEALRRVRERKQVRARERSERPEPGARAAARALEAAEAAVSACEDEVSGITRRLEDPELYRQDGGAEQAVRLGRELDAARARLDAAIAEWERAAALTQ
jgi:ATP-binding cassette subfamily F protein 3